MRYKVELETGHGCCMSASVVDTARPKMIAGKQYGFAGICECWDEATAEWIAAALNASGSEPEE